MCISKYSMSILKETKYLLTIFWYIPSSALASPPGEDFVLNSGKVLDSSFTATSPPIDQPQALTDSVPGPTGSYSSLKEEKVQSVKSLSKSNTQSPRGDLINSLWIAQFHYCFKVLKEILPQRDDL